MKSNESWLKSTPRRIRLLYYWGKFLGINPLSLSKKNKLKFSYFSMLYGCFLTVVYCFAYYGVLVERFKMTHPQTSVAIIVDFLAISWQFLVTSSTWLVFAINQKSMKTIMKSFATAEKTSEKLGIRDDWDKQLKECATHLILNNILFMFSFTISHTMVKFLNGVNMFVLASFDLPALASFNAGVIFILCLILVRRKFRRLNETVEFLNNSTSAGANDDGSSGLIRQSSCNSDLMLGRINMISQLHRELSDIIYHLEGHFASFVLFNIGNSFTFLTLQIFGTYRHMKGHSRNLKDLIFVGAVSHWIIYSMAALLVLSNVCNSISNEANNTGNMLHKMLNRCQHFFDNREGDKFDLLSMDLLQNKVSLSVYGLYKLDHYLVYRTVATGTTYLVIMLQLYV